MVDQPVGGVYPEHWEADVVLRDGGTAHLRPIHPADSEAVQAVHVGQSQKSVYLRFFAFKSKLSAKELKRFTEVDYKDRVALVITIVAARVNRLSATSLPLGSVIARPMLVQRSPRRPCRADAPTRLSVPVSAVDPVSGRS